MNELGIKGMEPSGIEGISPLGAGKRRMKKVNRHSRWLALLLVAILAVQISSPSGAWAAGDASMYIEGGSVEAVPGGTVSIPVKVYNNSGIMGLGLIISYDKDVFSSPVAKAGEVCVGTFEDSAQNAAPGSFDVIWSDTSETKKNGELFTVTFQVSEGASGNYSVSITNREGDTFNEQFEDVNPECRPASVTVKKTEPEPEPTPDTEPATEPTPDTEPATEPDTESTEKRETPIVEIYAETATVEQNKQVTIPLYVNCDISET